MTTGTAVFFSGFAGAIAGAKRGRIEKIMGSLGWDMLWLSDAGRSFYLNGAAGIGGQDELADRLRHRIESQDRVVFFGSSGGGFGALYYGLRLKPDAIVNFSGFTSFARETQDLDTRGTKVLPRLEALVPNDRERNLREAILESENEGMVIHHYYPRENKHDAIQALNISDADNVVLYAVNGSRHLFGDVDFPLRHILRFHMNHPQNVLNVSKLAHPEIIDIDDD